jgi:hypothetical protein
LKFNKYFSYKYFTIVPFQAVINDLQILEESLNKLDREKDEFCVNEEGSPSSLSIQVLLTKIITLRSEAEKGKSAIEVCKVFEQ